MHRCFEGEVRLRLRLRRDGLRAELRWEKVVCPGVVQNAALNEAWWAARDSNSARDGHRDQRRWADGWRRRLVTGRIRRDAAPEGREQRVDVMRALEVGRR